MATVEQVESERCGGGHVRLPDGMDEPCSVGEFLVVVGQRVRQRRALVRMSRRVLAERSGVSERYLAQLETGHGNMSIALLRKVAIALGLPLAELVREEASVRSS